MTLNQLTRLSDINGSIIGLWLDYLKADKLGQEQYNTLIETYKESLGMCIELSKEAGECLTYFSSISDLAEGVDSTVIKAVKPSITSIYELYLREVAIHKEWRNVSEMTTVIKECYNRLFK